MHICCSWSPGVLDPKPVGPSMRTSTTLLLRETSFTVKAALSCRSVNRGGHAPPPGMRMRPLGLRPAERAVFLPLPPLWRISILPFPHFLVTGIAFKTPQCNPKSESPVRNFVIPAAQVISRRLPLGAWRLACSRLRFCGN